MEEIIQKHLYREHNYFHRKTFKVWFNERLLELDDDGGDFVTGATNNVSSESEQFTRQKYKKEEKIKIFEYIIKFDKEGEFEDIEMVQELDEPIFKEHNYFYTKTYVEDNDTRLGNYHPLDDGESEDSITRVSNKMLSPSTQSTASNEKNNINFDEECEYEDLEILEDEDDSNMQEEIDSLTSSNGNSNETTTSNHKSSVDETLELKNTRPTRPGNETVLQIKTPNINNFITSVQDHHNKTNKILRNNNTTLTANSTISPAIDNNVQKINFYRKKQAELKYKEKQLKLEQTKIHLAKAKQVLNHMKELHDCEIE